MENANVIEGTTLPANDLSLGSVVRIPAVRQVILLIGVAVAVAAGFFISNWSQSPGMTQLFADLEAAEAADVADALRSANIEFKINPSTGDILVAETSLHDARMQLAAQGLPGTASLGMGSLDENSSFGTSQFMETARYQHALEAELGRTISSLGSVRDARVHLALPKHTSFLRDQKKSSASVMLQLFRGRSLESDQAAAVVNLVAASVPDLLAKDVTVVDQYGNLLSSAGQDAADAQATSQFKYTRRLEDTFKSRIEDLLTPLLGPGRVRAEVVADIDFTYVEETRESFDPNSTVVRSEQINEDLRTGNAYAAAGVPGSLSNQPPEAGGIENGQGEVAEELEAKNTSRSSVRNYEVDRTISHTRPQSSTVRRLSVAVLVDENPIEDGAEGVPPTAEEIARYEALVKEAVGFDAARGDTVVVMSQAFLRMEPAAEVAAPPFWKQPEMRDTLKQVLGAALILAIAFGIVRPMLRGVMASNAPAPISGEYLAGGQASSMPAAAGFAGGGGALQSPSYNEKVAAAKNITGHDPARVAQVVKQWVATDE